MADEAQSFNEGWDSTDIYLSVTQTSFIIFLTAPPETLRGKGGE